MSTNETVRVYQFGPIMKTLVVAGALGLIAAGVWGVMHSYLTMHGVLAQFGGCLLSMVPIAAALFGAPIVWQCRLALYEDRMEYHGLFLDISVARAEVVDVLSRDDHNGMFSIFLTLASQPLKRLHFAILGKMDDALARWVSAAPQPTISQQ